MKSGSIPFLILLIAAMSIQTQAQSSVDTRNNVEGEDTFIKVGVVGALTAAMSTADYHVSNVSRSMGFGSHFGIRGSFPLGPSARIVGEVAMRSLAFSDENVRIEFSEGLRDNASAIPGVLRTEGTFQYAMFTAMLHFNYFYIGFGYGIPASADVKNYGEGFDIPADGIDPSSHPGWELNKPEWNPEGRRIFSDITPATDDVNPLLELRIGGEYPIMRSSLGDLTIGLSLAYTFNNIIKDSRKNLPNYEDQFQLPNAMLHLAYLFNL
jgi:hypothetical protein